MFVSIAVNPLENRRHVRHRAVCRLFLIGKLKYLRRVRAIITDSFESLNGAFGIHAAVSGIAAVVGEQMHMDIESAKGWSANSVCFRKCAASRM